MKTVNKTKGEHQRRQRLSLRLKCVKLVQGGKSASEVARLHKQSPRAVAYWVTRFTLHGTEGIKDRRTLSGRPPKLNSKQIKQLQNVLIQFRKKSKPMNATVLSEYIRKHFGVTLTVRHCDRILKRLTA